MERQELMEKIIQSISEVALGIWDGPRLANQQAILKEVEKALEAGRKNGLSDKDLRIALAQGYLEAANCMASMED